jgi:hypothetical protein
MTSIVDELGGSLLVMLLICALLVGCGSISSGDAEPGDDAGAIADADHRDAGADVLEAGPVCPGTDDACPTISGGCAPSPFSCLGTRGACAAGEQLATRAVCGSAGVARPWCCPANVCDVSACHPCTTCP